MITMKICTILMVVLMMWGFVMGDETYPDQDQQYQSQESSECRNFRRVQTHVDISLVWKVSVKIFIKLI